MRKLFVAMAILVLCGLIFSVSMAGEWRGNWALANFTAAQTQYMLVPPLASGEGNIVVRYVAITTASAGELYLTDEADHAGGLHVVSPEWELSTNPLVLPMLHLELAARSGLYVTSDIAADHEIYVEYERTAF